MVEGFEGHAADIVAIRALNERYADAVNRRDAQSWGALWAEDALWDLMGTQVSGRAAIVGLWTQAMAGFSFVGFFSQLGALSVSGDTAQGRVWTHEVLEGPDGERRPLGHYEDHYVRREGQWLFARRNFSLRRP